MWHESARPVLTLVTLALSIALSAGRVTRLRRLNSDPTLDMAPEPPAPPMSDEAKAAILEMIGTEQQKLMDRIAALKHDVEKVNARVQRTNTAAQESMAALMGLQQEVLNVNNTAEKNYQMAKTSKESLEEIDETLDKQALGYVRLKGYIKESNSSLGRVRSTSTVKGQLDDAYTALRAVEPQLEDLQSSTNILEARVGGGRIEKVIRRSVRKEFMDLMEDVGRGWSSVPRPWIGE